MLDLIKLFLFKALDNGLSTFKTIYIQKEKYFIGSLFNSFSTFFYLLGVIKITNSQSVSGIISVCVATFIGTLLPGVFIKHSEADKLYIYEITATSFNSGKKFADIIRKYNISAIKTGIAYDNKMNKVLTCKIFCSTKEESKQIEKLIPKDFNYHVYVPIKEDN